MAALRKSLSGPMNGGLQPQASELLATHSISELRSLVQTLQSECGSKKSELQMMVGSKYHDFIESADAISSMYNASDAVGRNISDLSSLGKQVIEKSLALLDAKLPQSVVNSAAQSIYLKSDLSATKFWECVGSCNVFTAAEVLVTSGVLRSLLTGQGGMANTWLSDSFSNNDPMWDRFRVHVTSCSLADSLHVSLHLMTPLRLVLLEDAYFFLLLANEKSVSLSAQNSSKAVACSATGPQASPRQLAEALAALAAVRAFSVGDNCAELDDVDLSVLSSSLDPSILAASYASFMRVTGNDENKLSKPGGKPEVLIDMLKLYLDGATERIFSAVEGMGADARERIDESHDVWILYVGKLLNAIVTLQRSILDVYLIFFHHQSLRNSTLIETCCSDLAGSVVARLNALLTESYADDQPTSAQATFSLRSGGHPLAYGSLNRSEDSRRLLHDVWTQWMYGKRGTGIDLNYVQMCSISAY